MEDFFLKLSVMLVPGVLAITCHEVSHGFIAWRYGDPTARMLGRLTLNPIKHVDMMGTIIVPLLLVMSNSGILFGWAKPVPVVYSNLRNPKRDMIWVAAAGPITNILLATISALMLRGIVGLGNTVVSGSPIEMVAKPIVLMLAFSVYFNLLLAIFNMVPLPPLDGGRVLLGLLPNQQAKALARIEPYGIFIILLVFLILPRFFGIDIFSSVILPLLYFGIILLAGPQSSLILSVTHL